MNIYFESAKYTANPSQIPHASNPKHVYALVTSTLKYKPYILQIIKASKIKKSPSIIKLKLSDDILCLLIHDLLFHKGRIQSGKHAIKDAILQHKTRLNSELVKLKLKYKVKNVSELPNVGDDDVTPFRWIRVNQIKTSTRELMATPWFSALKPVESLEKVAPGFIYKDEYVADLFAVSVKEKVTATEAYRDGEIIIQDRASCFPAEILFGGEFQPREVIDSCAAPGNKTTHVAALLQNSGASQGSGEDTNSDQSQSQSRSQSSSAHRPGYRQNGDQDSDSGVVYAFERDQKRVETLKKMCSIATSNPNLIQITRADFTTVKPTDFPNVQGLIVDPSCSGSGIFGRALEDSEQENEPVDVERLNRLGRFQFSIMKHALSFPNALKVVYSTCSIHAEENERVVVDLLLDEEIRAKGWKLAPRSVVIPAWERRGWAQEFTSVGENVEELAGGCVRAMPKEDGGIGFFAACFIRDEAAGDEASAESSASAPSTTSTTKSSTKASTKISTKASASTNAATDSAQASSLDGQASSPDEEWTGFSP